MMPWRPAILAALLAAGEPAQSQDKAPVDPVELIRKLGNDDAAVREDATERLIEFGDRAEPLLRAELKTAGDEVRLRLQLILSSPYWGLDRETARKTSATVRRCDEHLAALTATNGKGRHGPFHDTDDKREREFLALLGTLPRFRGGGPLLLKAIDQVYLNFHANGYHGWLWHCPYVDCTKALMLADRLEREYPDFTEDAIFTRIYCYRVRGLDKGEEDPEASAAARAQLAWKADPERARTLCRELLEKYPKGRYATLAAELLGRKDLLIIPPSGPGEKVERIERPGR
jgi:hypothetical protein